MPTHFSGTNRWHRQSLGKRGKPQGDRRLIPALIALLVVSPVTGSALGEILLPSCFSDNMVLQRPSSREGRTSIWGWTTQRRRMSVVFQDQKHRVRIRRDRQNKNWYRWTCVFRELSLDPPDRLTIVQRNQEIVLTNVVVGDVWLIGVPPNPGAFFREAFFEDLNQRTTGRIRLLSARTLTELDHPSEPGRGWRVFKPDGEAGISGLSHFLSYFAAGLALTNRSAPHVGIIHADLATLSRLRPRTQQDVNAVNAIFDHNIDDYNALAFARNAVEEDYIESQKRYRAMVSRLKRRGRVPTRPPPPRSRVPTQWSRPRANALQFRLKGALW